MKKKIVLLVILILVIFGAVLLLKSAEKTPPPKVSEKTDYTKNLAESMTLKEKIGQMFLVCVSDSSISKEDISSYGLGGYLFFADFFEKRGPHSAAADILSYQAQAAVPMFMAADEEGGTVTRISRYPAYRKQPFASPQELYQEGGLKRIQKDTKEKSDLLRSIGINVNLAPVCDITEDKEAFIYQRTLGQDAETTAQYTAAVVRTMNESKMGSALKHFPGYGGNADTHTGIATDTRSLKTFEAKDFLPFRTGIDAGAPCVLVSHNIVACMDKSKPASLSQKAHDILRNDLGFDGVIMTDDLIMEGVQGYSKDQNIAVTAILAGNDLLCSGRYKEQIPAVLQAVKDGVITEKQITDSVVRILKWKEALGLIKEKE